MALLPQKWGGVIGNLWLAGNYLNELQFTDVIVNASLLGTGLNETFWVIRHIFVSSILIYSIKLLEFKLCRCLNITRLFITLVLIAIPQTFFIGVCCVGFSLNYLIKKIRLCPKIVGVIVIIVSFIMSFGLQNFMNDIFEILPMTQYWELFYVLVFIILIYNSTECKRALEGRGISRISSETSSFSVYLLHWPIICSVSSYLMLHLTHNVERYTYAYLIDLFLTVLLLFLVVWIYDKTVGRMAGVLMKKIVS